MTAILQAIAVVSIALILFGWLIYPIALRLFPRATAATAAPRLPADQRSVSVIIATRDAPELLVSRVTNLRASDYPPSQLAVIVALDASVADRVADYRALLGATAEVVAAGGAPGKAGALNAGVAAARSPILVFTDSAQSFAADTIRLLADALVQGPYAAISGRLVTNAASRQRGVADHFWNYEVWLREREARVHSVVGVTGAAYAMQRDLWTDLPDGVLCDDMLVPMRLVLGGRRIGLCLAALAFDSRRFAPMEEYRRKVRTQTGNLQLCQLEPAILNPRRNPIWLQFVCHKLLRIATPLLLLAAAPGLLLWCWQLLAPHLGGAQLWALVLVLVAAAVATAVARSGPFRQLRMLLLMLSAPLPALYFATMGRWNVWSRNTAFVAPSQHSEKV